MKKYLLSVIFAAIGLMMTTNVMAAAVAPSINETTKVNDDALKMVSETLYVVDLDADGNQIEETAQTAEVKTIIKIGNENVSIRIGDADPIILKVVDFTEADEDSKESNMVISCVDDDGDNVVVVLAKDEDGNLEVTVLEKDSATAFLNITVVE